MDWFFFALLTSFIVTLNSLAQKKILTKEHTNEFIILFSFINAVIFFPFLFFVDYTNFNLKVFILIYVISIFSTIAYYLVAKAIKHSSISEVSPLLIFGPAFNSVMGFLVLKEELTFLQWLGIFIMIIGMYVLESRRHQKILDPIKKIFHNKYLIFIFVALILYSIGATSDRFLMGYQNISSLSYLAVIHQMVFINTLIFMYLFHSETNIVYSLKHFKSPILIICFLTLSYRFTQMNAFALGPVGLVSAIKRTSGLFTTIIGGELFHEKNLFKKIFATMIIIFGTYLIII